MAHAQTIISHKERLWPTFDRKCEDSNVAVVFLRIFALSLRCESLCESPHAFAIERESAMRLPKWHVVECQRHFPKETFACAKSTSSRKNSNALYRLNSPLLNFSTELVIQLGSPCPPTGWAAPSLTGMQKPGIFHALPILSTQLSQTPPTQKRPNHI